MGLKMAEVVVFLSQGGGRTVGYGSDEGFELLYCSVDDHGVGVQLLAGRGGFLRRGGAALKKLKLSVCASCIFAECTRSAATPLETLIKLANFLIGCPYGTDTAAGIASNDQTGFIRASHK